jgi:hypothetical protein
MFKGLKHTLRSYEKELSALLPNVLALAICLSILRQYSVGFQCEIRADVVESRGCHLARHCINLS